MDRRSFMLTTAAGVSLRTFSPKAQDPGARAWFELRFYYLRNELDRSRLDSFLRNAYIPTIQRAAAGPVGIFSVSLGSQQPTLITVASHSSLASMEGSIDKMAQDTEYNKALDELDKGTSLVYSRMESRLLQAFESMPKLEVPPQEPARPPRLFELRIYEAKNTRASETKIKMFNDEEISIFRRTGLLPVFFGKTVIGTGLPSLTYMLAYDSVEDREKNWRTFLNHPDWIKLRSRPEFADSEIVSNITSIFLRPTQYSPIR